MGGETAGDEPLPERGTTPPMQTMNLRGPLLLQQSAEQLRGVTHPLHNVLASYDMQGVRSQALFGIVVAQEGRCDHTPQRRRQT